MKWEYGTMACYHESVHFLKYSQNVIMHYSSSQYHNNDLQDLPARLFRNLLNLLGYNNAIALQSPEEKT